MIRIPRTRYANVSELRAEYAITHPKPREMIPAGFWDWIIENAGLWATFLDLSLRAADKRPRYSARTVIEVMRWNTDILEAGGSFKIGNNHVPHMARLFNHLIGREFFALRDNGGRIGG